jgi:hypothetical protein
MAMPSEMHEELVPMAGELLQCQRWTLANVGEYRVFSAGVDRLHRNLKEKFGYDEADLMSMPKRKNGTSLLMQASFLLRLLDGRLEIKGCMESDVSAAQMDLRHLTCEQLLEIRVRNLDFTTSSSSHIAHLNFLDVLDLHLFEKLTQKLIRRAAPSPPVGTGRVLGRKVLLTLGAIQMLEDGWGSNQLPSALGQTRALPPHVWVLGLGGEGNPAIFNAVELWVDVPSSEQLSSQQLRTAANGGNVTIVCDSTSGVGRNRSLMLEINAVDPNTVDVIGAVAASHASASLQSSIALEAAKAVKAAKAGEAAEVVKVVEVAKAHAESSE